MLSRTLATATGVFLALAGSQLPEFAQQYRQRLGGAVDELQRVVQRFDADTAREGLSREQGLARLRSAPDEFSRRRAEAQAALIERHARLKEHQEDLRRSGDFGRLVALVGRGDAELIDRTLSDYEPAVPTTTEGATAAAGGFGAGYLLVRLLAAPLRRRPRWRSA